MILYENIKLNRTQIFADPPAMRGTSGQVYTDNIIIYNLKNFLICVHLPARAPGRLAVPVRHRLRLRRMPGRLGWRASLQWQAGLCPKKGNSYTMNLTIEENHGN
jgi:hypothetical protein